MQIVERHFFNKAGNDNSYSRLVGAARRFHRHGSSLCTQAEIVEQVSTAMWEFINKARQDSFLTHNEAARLFWQRICKVRVAANLSGDVGGFCVLHGELIGLWCDVPGKGGELIRYATSLGATRLNCFAGPLAELYSQFGFEEVRREPNWVHGEPDVVYMELQHD
jgi:hypothetical protein